MMTDLKCSETKSCEPQDIALKSLFLGPQIENSEWFRNQWVQILNRWLSWRKSLFPTDPPSISHSDQQLCEFQNQQSRLNTNVHELLNELEAEIPKFTPRYMGHMIAESSMPALIGHIATLLHNPNLTTREAAKVTSRLEVEAIHDLAQMIGFSESATGHFTGGGTVANIEALWRARYRFDNYFALTLTRKSSGFQDHFFSSCHMGEEDFIKMKAPFSEQELRTHSFVIQGVWKIQKQFFNLYKNNFEGPVVFVPGNKHFSWQKGVSLLGLGDSAFWSIELDEYGRLDVTDLKNKIEKAKKENRPILMIISVLGSTELGSVDPLHKIQKLLNEYKEKENLHFWHHIDAAYGGYYCSLIRGSTPLLNISSDLYQSLQCVACADSITLDPHKLGYIPYSCGALITRDQNHYPISSFHAPYLSQTPDSRWAFTLEGSRPSTGAVATWLSNKSIGLNTSGYGRLLQKGIEGKSTLQNKLKNLDLILIEPSDLNILGFSIKEKGSPLLQSNDNHKKYSLKNSNTITRKVYELFQISPNFSVSKTLLSLNDYRKLIEKNLQAHNMDVDDDHLFLIRLVIMNPFFATKELEKKLTQEFIIELQTLIRQACG